MEAGCFRYKRNIVEKVVARLTADGKEFSIKVDGSRLLPLRIIINV